MAKQWSAAVAAIGLVLASSCGSAAEATLNMAFPKTYNRIETWRLYGGFINHLAQCTKLQPVNVDGRSLAAGFDALDLLTEDKTIDLLRSGKVQLTQVSTGLVPAAMDVARGEPFAVRGDAATGRFNSYRVNLIVRADSAYLKPSDLAGKRIAHTTPNSNSGNLAPRAYFPDLGLTPDTNYKVVFSNGHERSIIGTQYGFWEAAAIASDQFERMARKGEIRRSDFRVLWSSDPFPASAWVMAASMPPATRELVRKCTLSYRIPPEVSRLLEGSDRFVPIDPAKDFAPVRFVMSRKAAAAH